MARDIHRVSGAEGSRFCHCTSCIPLFKQMTQKLPETYGLENCEVVLSENSVSSRPNCWSSFSQHTHCHCLGCTPFLDKAKYHIVGLSPTIFPSNITMKYHIPYTFIGIQSHRTNEPISGITPIAFHCFGRGLNPRLYRKGPPSYQLVYNPIQL